MKPKNIEQAVLFTVSYFDIFDYAPTFFEVWRYLFSFQANLDEVIDELDRLIIKGMIEMKNGFYFLPERSNLVKLRGEKYEISEKFWKRAVFASKILSYLPFIKTIAVVNSLAFFNSDTDSDIDFLIIAEKNKIWTTRFLSAIFTHFFGIRRHGQKTKKRICLSFYVSESGLDLEYIAKDELGFFVAFWIAQSTPLTNQEKTFEKFRNQNKWIYGYLPNCGKSIVDYHVNYKKPAFSGLVSNILRILLRSNFVENILRSVQSNKIAKTQSKIGNPKSVIYNDEILKFHPVDLRVEYKDKLDKNLKQTWY